MAFSSFKNDQHFKAGAVSTLAGTWGENTSYATFDPGTDIIANDGIKGTGVGPTSGPWFAAYSSGATIVVTGTINEFNNIGADIWSTDYVMDSYFSARGNFFGGGSNTPSLSWDAPLAGFTKVAFTAKSDGSVSAVVNGGTIYTATGDPGTFEFLSLFVQDGSTIDSVAVYAPLPDVDLQTLTAPVGSQGFNWQTSNANVTLGGSNRTVEAFNDAGNFASIPTSWYANYGQWYAEFVFANLHPNADIGIGMAHVSVDLSTQTGFPGGGYDMAASTWWHDGTTLVGTGVTVANAPTLGTLHSTDIWGIAFDIPAGKAWLIKNGVSLTGDPATGTNPWLTWDATDGLGWSPFVVVKDNSPIDAVAIISPHAWYAPPSGFSHFTD